MVSPRLNTVMYQGLKEPESLTTTKVDEHEGLTPVNLIKEQHGSQIFNKDTGTEEIRVSSNVTPGLQELGDQFESQTSNREESDDRSYFVRMGRMIYWRSSRYLRPTVRTGYIRLEWQCDCGAPLYGDFHASDRREVDKLGVELQATGYEPEVQDNHGIKLVPTGQENSDTSNPIGPEYQRTSAGQSVPAQYSNANVQLPGTSFANPGVSTTSVAALVPHPPPRTKKFAAICVNTGEFHKTLGEIEISSKCADR
ncbi:hypothetical protein N431DRAFT_19527 [Stipitochalara longipes BDJ]|nr:hypothetical protein N431DRAFT_19527 [Stipitochalara longipes BDJ]